MSKDNSEVWESVTSDKPAVANAIRELVGLIERKRKEVADLAASTHQMKQSENPGIRSEVFASRQRFQEAQTELNRMKERLRRTPQAASIGNSP
jgi:hypothetical protein